MATSWTLTWRRVNPLMPKRKVLFAPLYRWLFLRSKCDRQLTLAFLAHYVVPKAHNVEGQNLLFPLQIKSAKASLWIFIFCTLGTNGLKNWGSNFVMVLDKFHQPIANCQISLIPSHFLKQQDGTTLSELMSFIFNYFITFISYSKS